MRGFTPVRVPRPPRRRPLLGFLFPRPPLEVAEKAWVERHLAVLARRLGPDRLGFGGPVPDTLLPSATPEAGKTGDDDVRALTARFAAHLGLDADGLRVEWFEDRPSDLLERGRSTLGTWRRDGAGAVIGLNSELRADPASLAATVAHELCHEALSGGPGGDAGHGGREEEPMTDLATAALGLGLFTANGAVRESAGGGAWSVAKAGYLTSREIGYALACLRFARGEEGEPTWVGELRPDAAEAVTGGLRYLRRTGDTRFTADTARGGPPVPTGAAVTASLRHRRPSERLAAAWDAAGLPAAGAGTRLAVCEATRDREPAVRAAACAAAAAQAPGRGESADDWERALLSLIAAAADPTAGVRAAALRGLAALPDLPAEGPGREELDRAVRDGLTARTPAVRAAAAAVLPRLPPAVGEEGEAADAQFAPAVLKALVGALVRCDDAEAAEHAAVLHALHPDPPALAAERVDDEETRARVLDALGAGGAD